MGKRVIVAADGPGFLVNRCNRPFGLEALRLVPGADRDVEQVDRICRLGGGFRMGPFELMDLVGVDIGFDVRAVVLRAVASASRAGGRRRSPRGWWPPGRPGRKPGRGYYDYRDGRAPPGRSATPPARGRRRRAASS